MSRRRKKSGGSGDSGGSWMDSYGDMVTLLLAFFVLLFSFSTIDADKWKSMVGAFSGAGITSSIVLLDPSMAVEQPIILSEDMAPRSELNAWELEQRALDYYERTTQNQARFEELYGNVSAYITENGLSAELYANHETSVLILRFVENVLFDSGRADILGGASEVMNHIIQMINENGNNIQMVRIEGHTDTIPNTNSRYADNWELSVQRAVNVLRYMLESGKISNEIITAVGYGEFHPVAPNDTTEGRAKNRRVDFVIESKTI